jgi:hypothetical protein
LGIDIKSYRSVAEIWTLNEDVFFFSNRTSLAINVKERFDFTATPAYQTGSTCYGAEDFLADFERKAGEEVKILKIVSVVFRRAITTVDRLLSHPRCSTF